MPKTNPKQKKVKEKCLHKWEDLAVINYPPETSVVCNKCGEVLIKGKPTHPKLPKEIEEKFNKMFWNDKVGFSVFPHGYAKDKVKSFLSQILAEERQKIFTTITKELGVEVKDLPAFPPKDADLIALALKIGIAKVRQEAETRGYEKGFRRALAGIMTERET